MSHEIWEKCVYSYKQPMWHSITEPSEVEMSAEGVIKERFGDAPTIFMRPVTVELNGSPTETGDFAVIRGATSFDSNEVVFDYATDHYHPLQPIEVARSFDRNVQEPAETLAFLRGGREMFISWLMPEIEVVVDDIVKMFGIVRVGFDTKNGARLFTSSVRPVCWNTITWAEDWARAHTDGKGKGRIWDGKATNVNLLRDLGYWMEHVQLNALREAELLKQFFGNLAVTPIKSETEAWRILFNAYPNKESVSEYYPVQLQADKELATVQYNNTQQELRQGIFNLFDGAGTAITPDYWGMLNATSEYFCHYQSSKKPIAESVMFGPRAKNISRMVEVLASRIE